MKWPLSQIDPKNGLWRSIFSSLVVPAKILWRVALQYIRVVSPVFDVGRDLCFPLSCPDSLFCYNSATVETQGSCGLKAIKQNDKNRSESVTSSVQESCHCLMLYSSGG